MTHPAATAKPRLGWVMALTSTAYFMVVLDSTVLITALPNIQRGLRAGLASLQWTFNAYGIAFAAGIITAAPLGDRFGRRRVFNRGLAVSTLASAACMLAPSTGELIAARTVQGLGGAVVLPLSLTIVTTACPARKRGMIVGGYGGLAGLAVALGPVVATFAAAFFVTQEFQFARGYSPLGSAPRLLRSSPRRCSSRPRPGRCLTASAAARSWSPASRCRRSASSGSQPAAPWAPAGSS
jgi:MFS family permease